MYCVNDDGCVVNVVENELRPIDIELKEEHGLIICDEKYQASFIKEVKDQENRIQMINGLSLNFEYFDGSCYYCDYCNTGMDPINSGKEYHFCKDCQKDMCLLCYGETSEEVAKNNGAKNYELRKDELEKCRQHNLLERKFLPKDFNVEWDYDEQLDPKYFRVIDQIWEYTSVGSILDWVPILRDEEHNQILINLNTESQYSGQIAMLTNDDHGRSQISTFPDMTFEEIFTELKTYPSEMLDVEGKKDVSWNAFYSLPIQMFCRNRNIRTSLG